MYSQEKHEDKLLLLEIAEMIETLVKVSEYDLAGKFGEHYEQLAQKIKTYPYREDNFTFTNETRYNISI